MVNEIANPDQHLPQYVVGYINHPRETFSCELKPWINPSANAYDQVKIAKICLALRNKDGGTLLIGLSDEGESMDVPDNYDPNALFTQDTVQAIVSAYSAQQFGVDVHHVELSEPQNHQVVAIVVPGGIKSPALCRKDSATDQYPSVKKGFVYTRTVASNGTISSAPASQQDIDDITQTCFDNRVADIGQFLGRHLTKQNLDVLKAAIEAQDQEGEAEQEQDQEQELEEFAAASAEAFIELPAVDGND